MAPEFVYCPACAGRLENRPAGDARLPHPTCVECGFVLWQNRKPCVDALITRGDSAAAEVLLGRQADGTWDLPGNFLNATDRIESALRRECKREMDVDVDVGELLGAYEDVHLGMAIVTLVYACTVRSGEPRPADLIDEVRWWRIAEPPPLAAVAVERALGDLRERFN